MFDNEFLAAFFARCAPIVKHLDCRYDHGRRVADGADNGSVRSNDTSLKHLIATHLVRRHAVDVDAADGC